MRTASSQWWARPSPWLVAVSMVGPGLVGGVGVLFGLPAFLLLLLTAGAAGFVVAYPARGQPRLSAYTGLGANAIALIVAGLPFIPGIVADPAFREAAQALIGPIGSVAILVLGVGAIVGYGGGWVGRDVARHNVR
jgi:hypothetical protein